MNDKEMKKAAKEFADRWKNKGDEKSDTQKFWLDLLTSVLGVSVVDAMNMIDFEFRVHGDDSTTYGDAYIKDTKILIEQKSLNKNLRKAIRQGDGSLLTPFQQAKRYIVNLPVDEHPRYVITSNFESFLIYDMNQPHSEPDEIWLKDLDEEAYRLQFIVKAKETFLHKEMEVSIKAGELVGLIYDALIKEYKNIENKESLHSLNVLCVRLVFCLYAEDAGIFGRRGMFYEYLSRFSARDFRRALIDLFEVLNTEVKDRDPYLDDELAVFPYVNGGLFEDEKVEIPHFTNEIRNLILNNASKDFDWSQISPTIFGAVFESTLNPETRRKGGMHYTSIENIHKVIDPLFLDELKEEFNSICEYKVEKTRNEKLRAFQDKLANLKFFDPASGSGNFLTETYMCIRRLENNALEMLNAGQIGMNFDGINTIKVNINQFYGVEINDFACSVAKTALWIAESQMMKETEEILHMNLDFLPLKTNANIIEGNALTLDWENIITKDKLNYIMGNPPFTGSKYSEEQQKKDMDLVFRKYTKKYRKLDYVACWYIKAMEYIGRTKIKAAFVSTNSITQGEQVSILWPIVFNNGMIIDFAYRTFRWDSEASVKAAVHCVIIGFRYKDEIKKVKRLYDNGRVHYVDYINAYLVNGPEVTVSSRKTPLINDIHTMVAPNKPCDYNNLKIEPDEFLEFKKHCPESLEWIKKMVGAQEFINNKERYCLWLVDCSPENLKSMPMVLERVRRCKEARIAANTKESLKLAETPMLFREQLNPDNYLLIPCVSSENRKYVPMAFLNKDTIPVMGTLVIPNASQYEFGVLTSNVHMSWMRAVCGRLESRYRYSKDIVYNNFPWPEITDIQKKKIEETAKSILEARALYSNSSLADLYDEVTMPPELRKAHQENDKAVMEAYGFNWRTMTESDCVAELMKMYQKLTEK